MINGSTVNSNFSWINDVLGILARERQAMREQDLKMADINLRREAQQAVTPQGTAVFNPLPGTVGQYPQSEASERIGPMRIIQQQLETVPTWGWGLMVAVVIIFGLKLFKK